MNRNNEKAHKNIQKRPSLPNGWGLPVRVPGRAPAPGPTPALRAPGPGAGPALLQPPPVRRPLLPPLRAQGPAPLIIEAPPLDYQRAPPMRSTTPARRAHRALANSLRLTNTMINALANRSLAQSRRWDVSNTAPASVSPSPLTAAVPAVQRSTTPRPSSASRSGRPPPAPPAQTRKRVRNGLPPLHPGAPLLVRGPTGLTTRKANPNTKIVNGIAIKKRNGL